MNINLPETFVIESRGKTVTLDIATITADIIARAALHGLKQKVSDAAAGAAKAAFRNKAEGETAEVYDAAFKAFRDDEANAETIAATGLGLMQKVADAILAGDWGVERGSGAVGLDTLQMEMARIMSKHLTFAKGTKTSDKYALAWDDLQSRPEDTIAKIRKMAEREIERQREIAALSF